MRHSHVRSGKDSWYHLLDCRDDVGIRGAPTEIATHALPNLVVIECYMVGVQIGAYRTRPAVLGLAQHPDRRADLSRRTVAALECIVSNERPLEGVQILTVGEPFDRDDLGVLMRDGEREA